MSDNSANLLSLNANKLSLAIPPVTTAVSRAARELALATGAHATSIKNEVTLRIDMLRHIFTYSLAGLWATLALHEVPVRASRDTSRVIEPVRMTIEDPWRRATGILSAALTSFQRVKTLQAAAARQIDSADYALTQLIHDLRAAMPLPADVSALRAVLAEAERTAPGRQRRALAA
jgi:hypothetical protein